MEVFLGFIIIAILLDIEEKLKRFQKKEKLGNINLNNYLNKDVYIVLKNDNVTNSYLFSTTSKTIGKIIDFDNNWFIFNYYNKNEKKNTTQYLRINDLRSINEIK